MRVSMLRGRAAEELEPAGLGRTGSLETLLEPPEPVGPGIKWGFALPGHSGLLLPFR